MPLAQLSVRGGKLVMSGVEEVAEHAEEIEIDKQRPAAEKKWFFVQHLFAGDERFFDLLEQGFLLLGPLLKATAAKAAFFVAHETEMLFPRNILAPVNIIEL